MKQQKITIPLIISSLGLLLVFLTFWVRGAYQDEKKALEQEMNLLFLKSLRNAEKGVMDISSIRNTVRLQKIDINSDSTLQQTHSEIKVMVIDARNQKKLPQTQIITDSNRTKTVTWTNKSDSAILNATFLKNFDTLFQKSKLPFRYELKHIDSNASGKNIFLTFDNLGGNKKQFALQSADYQWYLVKKMIPHISFSLLLFGAVALSFWLMYRNAKIQNNLLLQKNAFISNITHELNSPLTSVNLAIEALQKMDLTIEQKKAKNYLNIADTDTKRLSNLVEKILKISILEEKTAIFNFEKIDFSTFLEKEIRPFELQVEQRNGSFIFEKNGDDFTLNADAAQLTSAIHNLLENAIKYSPETPNISVQLFEKNNRIQLIISDKGQGFGKEYQDKIFEKFYRIPTGDIHNVKGYGLGLSQVKEILDAHNAKIFVKSEEGKGSAFEVVF